MGREGEVQRTYIMLKPDAYLRGIVGDIISRIERKGFKITAMKMMNLSEDILRVHYSHIAERSFFPEIVESMTEGPVVAMIIEGAGVIEGMRRLIGPTKWEEAPAGTIRGDYAFCTGKNLIHGSDGEDTAKAEIKRFFPELA